MVQPFVVNFQYLARLIRVVVALLLVVPLAAAGGAIIGVIISSIILIPLLVVIVAIAVPSIGITMVALSLLAHVAIASVRFRSIHRAQRAFATGAQQEARAASLRAWMAETEKILKRYEYAECPAPPVPLTPEDCAAAGFTFDDECRARYLIVSLTDLMLLRSAREFQLNFHRNASITRCFSKDSATDAARGCGSMAGPPQCGLTYTATRESPHSCIGWTQNA
jgi:hypothetical protein